MDTVKFYPIADRVSSAEARELGLEPDDQPSYYPTISMYGTLRGSRYVRAVRTGEFREPRKGEWYLSGAPREAYRAPNDLGCPYSIMRLVVTKLVTSEVLV